jgi:hypothetical protein
LCASSRLLDFHALPDRKRYPDYYEAIPEPVCLDEVEVGRVPQPASKLSRRRRVLTSISTPRTSGQNKLDRKEFSSAQAFIVDLQVRPSDTLVELTLPLHALGRVANTAFASRLQLVFQNAMHCASKRCNEALLGCAPC